MKPFPVIAAMLSCLVLLTGCPFESRVPLGKPAASSIDPRLIGSWIGRNAEEPDTVRLSVIPFNDGEYYVEVREDDGRVSRYRAFFIGTGAESVFQLNELPAGGPPESYLLGRCSFGPDGELTIRFVGDRIVPADLNRAPEKLLAFVSSHAGDPALLDEEVRIVLRPDR